MQGFFYGWYMKCQSDTHTLAVIPAVHQVGRKRTCSIQVITDKDVWTVAFQGSEFQRRGRKIFFGRDAFADRNLFADRKRTTGKNIYIGKNRFGRDGIRLAVHTPDLSIEGKLDFGPLSPLRYDIMGPFAFVPFMECRHSVWSMRHLVCGTVHINGQEYSFQDAWGYWEGDRGRSFPEKYLWTQCCFQGGSLMLSVADIPIAGIHFTGIICVVLWQGKEYRLATYLGARAVQIRNRMVRIVQGNLELEAGLLEETGRPLKAPTRGEMVRTIHESAACRAFYRFRIKGHTIFSFETDKASFEYEWDG